MGLFKTAGALYRFHRGIHRIKTLFRRTRYELAVYTGGKRDKKPTYTLRLTGRRERTWGLAALVVGAVCLGVAASGRKSP